MVDLIQAEIVESGTSEIAEGVDRTLINLTVVSNETVDFLVYFILDRYHLNLNFTEVGIILYILNEEYMRTLGMMLNPLNSQLNLPMLISSLNYLRYHAIGILGDSILVRRPSVSSASRHVHPFPIVTTQASFAPCNDIISFSRNSQCNDRGFPSSTRQSLLLRFNGILRLLDTEVKFSASSKRVLTHRRVRPLLCEFCMSYPPLIEGGKDRFDVSIAIRATLLFSKWDTL